MTQTKTQHLRVTRVSSHGDKVFGGAMAEVIWQELQKINSALPDFETIQDGGKGETSHIRYEVIGSNEALWLWAKDEKGEEELYQLLFVLASEEDGWGLAGRHTFIEVYHPETGEPMGGDFFGNEHGISLSSFHVNDDGIVRVIKDVDVEPLYVNGGALDSQHIMDEFRTLMLGTYPFVNEDYSNEIYWVRWNKQLTNVQRLLRDAIQNVGYKDVFHSNIEIYSHISVNHSYPQNVISAFYTTHDWVVNGYGTMRRDIVHRFTLPKWVNKIVQPGELLSEPQRGTRVQGSWADGSYEPLWTKKQFLDGLNAYKTAKK